MSREYEVEVIIYGEDRCREKGGLLDVCVGDKIGLRKLFGCSALSDIDIVRSVWLLLLLFGSNKILEFGSKRVHGHRLLLEFIEFLDSLSFFLFLLCLFLQGIPLLDGVVEIADNFTELIVQEFIHGFP